MTRVLSRADLNRTVLARQMLMERSSSPLHRAVERMAGVQTQYAPSAYIGLWSRIEGFARRDLTDALERRSLIQATVMRGTIHIVSRGDFWPLVEASRPPRQDGWIRAWGRSHDLDEVMRLSTEVRRLLADAPMKRKAIVDSLGIDSETWNGIVNWVDLVRVPPSGTWDSRRADLYWLASSWVGPNHADLETGRDLLVRRYLTGFGPATRQDIQAFTLMSLAEIDESLSRVRTRRFRSEDGDDLWDVPGAAVVDGEAPAPVRFIGNWDAILLIHCRRSGVLPEEHRPQIFNIRAPHSSATFLIDGRVRGSWSEEGGRVVLDRFEPIPRRFSRELTDERSQLEAFLR
ncbi:MAG TPA: winged helix DNA-binding domain-containing protein [Acidimicrobiia bacterium]|nr:winged helix DNA-binding domain-containing protein [Acidimicrobiia bacterium]